MPESWDGSSDDADDHIPWTYDSCDDENALAEMKNDFSNDENAFAEMISDLNYDFSNDENALAEIMSDLENDLKNDSSNDENALAEIMSDLENDLKNYFSNDENALAEMISDLNYDFSNNENALAEMISNLKNDSSNDENALAEMMSDLKNDLKKDSSDLKNKGICSEQSDHVEEGAGNNLHLAPQNSTLGGPRKKLLVMALGGLLCHRVCKRDVSDIPKTRHPDAFYGSILVYKRPFCEEFMKFCLDKFDVGIWSSAKELYLDSALDCIVKGLKSKLLFAWDQVECSDSGFKSLENTKKPIFFKEFKKLQKFSIQYSATNTLLIDDNPYKALLNPPHTAIFPNEYKTDQVGDVALGPGGDLRLYLEGLADANDVPSYVKEHPFGQPAITPLHSDWEFYSGVVCHFQKE